MLQSRQGLVQSVSVADLNGDTVPDVVISDAGGSMVLWLTTVIEPGVGLVFVPGFVEMPGVTMAVAGDIDGNGLADLVVGSYVAGLYLSWLPNVGTVGVLDVATFSHTPVPIAIAASFIPIVVLDVDGDGDLDVRARQ